jgi:glycosyltransferase involved in cell wall biosynthesis
MPFMIDTRPLRIAYLVHDYNRYMGHSRYVSELATRFRHQHEVHVFANTVDDHDTAGITFHHVAAWRRNALATIVSFALPATAAVRGRFDIIHAQGLCGLRQNVITAHVCQPAWYAAADQHLGRQRWRKRVFRAVVTRLDRLVMRPGAAARYIAPSGRVRDELAAYYGLDSQIRVVHHGTDTKTFHPTNRDRWRRPVRTELGLTETDCVALYVGDMQKAFPVAIQALTATTRVKLVVVSRTDPAPYVALAAGAGVAGRVRFVSLRRDIARYYAAADIFLFPTYYDTFGMVVSEAMASGLPVLTNRMAGAAELITDGVDGLLTERAWDAPAIAAILNRLDGDCELRMRLGAAARRRIEPLTWDRTAEETLGVYREVLAAQSA